MPENQVASLRATERASFRTRKGFLLGAGASAGRVSGLAAAASAGKAPAATPRPTSFSIKFFLECLCWVLTSAPKLKDRNRRQLSCLFVANPKTGLFDESHAG